MLDMLENSATQTVRVDTRQWFRIVCIIFLCSDLLRREVLGPLQKGQGLERREVLEVIKIISLLQSLI